MSWVSVVVNDDVALLNKSKITPVILLSKCDLISQDQVEKIQEDISSISPETNILPFSNLSGENIDTIRSSLLPGQTYCLLGSSGVGKTTLLNSILGAEQFETQSVSKKDGKGKHTTTRRELIILGNGALLIDIHARLLAGEDEVFLKVSDDNRRVIVVAVRDPGGNLMGYYERFERLAEQFVSHD